MKLYEITDEFLKLYEQDEPDEELMQALAKNVQKKAEGITKFVKNLDSDENAIAEEIKVLTAKKKAITNKKDSIKAYVKENMERLGIDKLDAGIFKITLQNNSQPSVVISCEPNELPEDLQVTTISVDKKLLLKRYKETGLIPNGVEITTGKHVRIR